MRTLILHHHLFKNAGTSVDVALRRAFGSRWKAVEAPEEELKAADLLDLAEAEPALAAVSSHTFRPPFGVPGRLRILPIILLRDPLDRALSAYDFERKQQADTLGAKLAKEVDFAGYISTLLNRPGDRSMRNFQTNKLSTLPRNNTEEAVEFTSAVDAISRLPFVGLVERYDASMHVFARHVSREVEPCSFEVVRENTTRRDAEGLEVRLARAEAALGPELATRFHAANRHDQALVRLIGWMHDRVLEAQQGSYLPR